MLRPSFPGSRKKQGGCKAESGRYVERVLQGSAQEPGQIRRCLFFWNEKEHKEAGTVQRLRTKSKVYESRSSSTSPPPKNATNAISHGCLWNLFYACQANDTLCS